MAYVIKTLRNYALNYTRFCIKVKSHLLFNETCVINKLLPVYTNIRLHDDAARKEPFVEDFRLNLIKREIVKQKEIISSLNNEYSQQVQVLEHVVQSNTRISALLALLERVSTKTYATLYNVQNRKLCALYGANIYQKQERESVVNLSQYALDEELKCIFSYGMNCHLKQKTDPIKKKVEIEKLYEDIQDKVRQDKLSINNIDVLKCELERFGMRRCHDIQHDVLTPREHQRVKELRKVDSIVIRKADKSNVFVILDETYYDDKINEILNNGKFEKIEQDTSSELKQRLNQLISKINRSAESPIFKKIKGQFKPSYIHANPKIHERLENPPMRPIISQIGTVTYDISKQVDSIIKTYMPKTHMVESTYEFLNILKCNSNPGKVLASMDVESLFTNVPVHQTIDIILECVYNHPQLPPPPIPRDILRELLEICTTKIPFTAPNGDLYVQKDGVSMGGVHGPCFANYYMCYLENKIFNEIPNLKPILYLRYVDDIYLILENKALVNNLQQQFESNSVLKFTFEFETKNKLPFLDVLLQRTNTNIVTSVYVKSTNYGDCLNFNSICPTKYKISVIKGFLHRAYHVSQNWLIFDTEVQRIKQLLTNNNFPMSIIDETVNKFINNILSNTIKTKGETVQLFFQSQMCSNYRLQEHQLQKIIADNVKSTNKNCKVQLQIYYRNRKLKSLLIRNNNNGNKSIGESNHVVYKFTCTKDGCNSTKCYIGYTTCSLAERFRTHQSVRKHLLDIHNQSRVPTSHLLESVSVLRHCKSKRDLKYTEAILIKQERPSLNSQDEGCDQLLKIFKH